MEVMKTIMTLKYSLEFSIFLYAALLGELWMILPIQYVNHPLGLLCLNYYLVLLE
jgi:hypothetical protein